jgi:hypothetical protein
MIGAYNYFPDTYNNLIDTIIEKDIPFEMKHSDTFYINPYTYGDFVTFYFDLIDTTTVSPETAQNIEFNV